MVFMKKDCFMGQWKNNKKQGEGRVVWENGDVFVGTWNKGQVMGMGRVCSVSEETEDPKWQAMLDEVV